MDEKNETVDTANNSGKLLYNKNLTITKKHMTIYKYVWKGFRKCYWQCTVLNLASGELKSMYMWMSLSW